MNGQVAASKSFQLVNGLKMYGVTSMMPNGEEMCYVHMATGTNHSKLFREQTHRGPP